MKLRVVNAILLTALLVSCISIPLLNPNPFREKFNPKYYSELWSESQYVKGDASPRGISDGEAYAYAGWHYIRGGDPSTVNFEHPPLGKYLVGLSIVLFNNLVVINLPIAALLLGATYLLSLHIFKNKTLALIPTLALSLDPMFRIHIGYVLLDMPAALLFALTIISFLKAADNKKWYIAYALCAGLLIATKFYINTAPLLGLLTLWAITRGKEHARYHLTTLPLALVPFLASYAMYFVYHPSLLQFISYQKWLTVWWTGTPLIFGNFLHTLFTGQMYTWSGTQLKVSVPEYSVLHPVLTLVAVMTIAHKDNKIRLLAQVSAVYVLFLSIGTGFYRYLLLILPLLYVISGWVAIRVIVKLRESKKGDK